MTMQLRQLFLCGLTVFCLCGHITSQIKGLSLDVPYVHQKGKLCGPASLAMVLQYWGVRETQHTLRELIPIMQDDGVEPEQLKKVAEEAGFTAFVYSGDFEDLEHHLSKGRPIIVQIQSSRLLRTFHYIVVVGVDHKNQTLLVHDPGSNPLEKISYSSLRRNWGKTNFLSILILPKQPEAN